MTQEVDIDEVLFGQEIDLGGGRGTVSRAEVAAATVEAEQGPPERVLQQLTMEGGHEPVKGRPAAAEYVVAVILRSRSDNARPHVVTILTFPDGSRATACICEAMLSVARRPEGCWAMAYVRDLVGIPQPVPPGGPA